MKTITPEQQQALVHAFAELSKAVEEKKASELGYKNTTMNHVSKHKVSTSHQT
uniref:Uncharacterized protein n=1 Tax=Arundo donax TaxID=35708 RepID=A0A0A9GGE9_ARUDO